jgi:septum formation protein
VKLILASASPRRALLLKQVGIPFQVIPSTVNEAVEGFTPEETVVKLALAKARQVAAGFSDGLVLGADTVVVYQDTVLGKPRSAHEARRMLLQLSGGEHRVITGLALVDAARGGYQTASSETRVWMRALESELIDAYVATGEPMDKAGAYGIQEKAAFFVERIEGCYFNVVGLPLTQLYLLLSRMEIKPWFAWRDSEDARRRAVDD